MNYEQLINSIQKLQDGHELIQNIGDINENVFLQALMTRLSRIDGEFSTEIEDGILHVAKNSQQVAA